MNGAFVGPLAGKRIVITRSQEAAGEMARKLAALGAIPICLPVIDFVPLPAPELDSALARLSQYDWLIFTSANAARFFFARVEAVNSNQPLPITNYQLRLAAVGQTTARFLAEKGIEVDFMPEEFTGEQLALGLGDVAGRRILLPRARIGRPEIANLLRERGAVVEEIALYDTVTAVPDLQALAEIEKGVDVITFTSPSAVRNFLEVGQFAKLPNTLIGCIGPSTAEEAAKHGLTADIIPEVYTIDGLITAIVDYYEPDSKR